MGGPSARSEAPSPSLVVPPHDGPPARPLPVAVAARGTWDWYRDHPDWRFRIVGRAVFALLPPVHARCGQWGWGDGRSECLRPDCVAECHWSVGCGFGWCPLWPRPLRGREDCWPTCNAPSPEWEEQTRRVLRSCGWVCRPLRATRHTPGGRTCLLPFPTGGIWNRSGGGIPSGTLPTGSDPSPRWRLRPRLLRSRHHPTGWHGRHPPPPSHRTGPGYRRRP